jgi:hypothetical protein
MPSDSGFRLSPVSRIRLWAITSYFNPARYARRRANYRVFRDRLDLPLLTVELVFDETPELGDGDADILVQLPGRDLLWHKERLLNLAAARLPATCDRLVWLDCDVFFADDGWAPALDRILDEAVLAQPYASVHYLTRHWSAEDREPEIDFSRRSVAAALAGGMSLRECFLPPVHDRRLITAPGFAWGARRDLMARHGIYDAAIVGGGDRLLASAACGFLEGGARVHFNAPRLEEHYRRWAVPFAHEVGGRVGFVEAELFNLWHGDLANRDDRCRNQRLIGSGFDPFADIAADERGVWRWNSDRPALHVYLRDYFASRREDG